MMRAADFRARARYALKGRWGLAVAVGLVASLLTSGFGVSSSGGSAAEESGYLSFVDHRLWIVLMTVAVVSMLLVLVIGGAVQLGWCRFNLNLINNKNPRFGDLFSNFDRLGTGFCMLFVMGLFTFLWSLLLIIPGIIAAFRYAMVPYLMAEFPQLRVMEAMRESKRLMKGNKWRLFCLSMSFLGWGLLSALTLGIGNLWLVPYIQAAQAAFYMEVTGRGQQQEEPEMPWLNHGPEF